MLVVAAAVFVTTARASTIAVTITGITREVHVEEGPIFGYSSYAKIPDGTSFTLIYIFDEARGPEETAQVSRGVITQSEAKAASSSSPGVNATLQIGSQAWEFGPSTRSQITLNTSSDTKSELFTFFTAEKGNRVSAEIRPAQGGYWPDEGDWRQSFTANWLSGSSGSFSANNGEVSASGNLIPLTITTAGLNLDGQWLGSTTIAGGPGSPKWERQWHLAHVSRKGGYIVQRVTRNIIGTKPDGSPITPSSIEYWEAWRVAAGMQIVPGEMDRFTEAPGSTGDDTVTATARFYEGLILPPCFAVGNSPYAGSSLSSIQDPHLATDEATLPVTAGTTLHF